MLKISWTSKVSSTEVSNRIRKNEELSKSIQVKKLKYFCHIVFSYKKNYNICYIPLSSNYYATLQRRYHEEQTIMSTQWATHSNKHLNRQLNKHLKNGTHTIQILIDTGICFKLAARSATEAKIHIVTL